jgi:hypothetical protein
VIRPSGIGPNHDDSSWFRASAEPVPTTRFRGFSERLELRNVATIARTINVLPPREEIIMTQHRSAPTTFHRVRIGVALLAGGFLLAACGSSGSSAPGPVGSSAAVAQTSAASASAAAAAATPSSAAPSSAAASIAAVAGAGSHLPFCQFAKVEKSQEANELKNFTSDSPAQLEKFETQALGALSTFTASAPAQIKGAVQTVITADQKLFGALKAANFDYAKVSPTVLSSFDTPALTEASTQIAAYLRTTCGITSSPAS